MLFKSADTNDDIALYRFDSTNMSSISSDITIISVTDLTINEH